jgi:chromosome segregation ATPase
MESMKERLALEEQINHVKQKIPWVEFKDHCDRVEEVKQDREHAQARLKEMEKECKPIEKAVNELNARLTMLRAELRKKVRLLIYCLLKH